MNLTADEYRWASLDRIGAPELSIRRPTMDAAIYFAGPRDAIRRRRVDTADLSLATRDRSHRAIIGRA